MEQDDYRIELSVEQTDYGYMTRVRTSPVGPVSAPFELTVGRRQLAELQASLRAASQSDAFELTLIRERLQAWGHRLYDAVFRDAVLDCYRSSKRMADNAGRELRIHLDLSQMEELAQLPWEYLYDTRRQEFLGLSAGTIFARYSGLMHQLRPPERGGPLRALAVISSPDGYPEIDVQRAWLRLLDQIDYLARDKQLIIEWLQKPTLLDLQRQLRGGKYHILHFMGHSLRDAETGEGQLVFEDEMGRGRLVGGEHLGSLFRDHTSLRMVLLTGGAASRSSNGGTIGAGPGHPDVAQSLVKRGIGAVFATPFDLPVGAQVQYLARLYAQVAALMPVDRAAAIARTAVGTEGIWWGAPMLFSRTPDGNLFAEAKSELERLSPDARENIAFRLSALRIRTATPEAMARWSDELTESRLKRRIERD